VEKGPPRRRTGLHAVQLEAQGTCLATFSRGEIKIWGSPARFWCYRDEDFIGTVKTIAAKSHHPRTIEQRVLEKLLIVAGLEEAP
jgi:hypothetical protein